MRQLYLVDSVGHTFKFNHYVKALFTDIDGLGFERENTYLNYDGTYKLAYKENKMQTISGKIIFLNGYAGYNDFLNFIKSITGDLRLFYKGYELKYAYVELVSLDKSELEKGVLQCKVKFDRLSMWLSKNSSSVSVKGSSYIKSYGYTYPFTYSSTFTGSITVTNNGCVEAPIIVEITGKCKKPVVQIFNGDELVSELRLLVENKNYDDVIVVNAIPTEQEMTNKVNGISSDIYSYQDFNFDNFLFLPVGTYTIKFTPGVNEYTKCKITWFEMYEGN